MTWRPWLGKAYFGNAPVMELGRHVVGYGIQAWTVSTMSPTHTHRGTERTTLERW